MYIFFAANMQLWNITVPRRLVPADVTTWMCQGFQFPDWDNEYHIVAMEPFVDNRHVTHHIALQACPNEEMGKFIYIWPCKGECVFLCRIPGRNRGRCQCV